MFDLNFGLQIQAKRIKKTGKDSVDSWTCINKEDNQVIEKQISKT